MNKVKYYVIMDTDQILWNTFSTDLNLLQSLLCDLCFEEAYIRFYCQMVYHTAQKFINETEEEYAARLARSNWKFAHDRHKRRVSIIEIKNIEDIYNDKNN